MEDKKNDKDSELNPGQRHQDEVVAVNSNKDNKSKNGNNSENLGEAERAAERSNPVTDPETKDLFKPGDSAAVKSKKFFMFSKKQGGAAGLIIGITGMAIIFFMFIGSGPAQILQAAEWLRAINFTDQQIDTDVRLKNISIYSQIAKTGNSAGLEKTRLGILTTRHVGKIDLELKNRGLVGEFKDGKLVSYKFDKDLIPDNGDFKDLKKLEGDDLRKAVSKKLGVDLDADLKIDVKGTKQTRLVNKILANSVYKSTPNFSKMTTFLSTRSMNIRANVTLNPATKLKEFLKSGTVKSYASAREAMRTTRSEDLKSGKTIDLNTTNTRDSGDGDTNSDTKELDNNRTQFKEALKAKTPAKLQGISAKLVGTGASQATVVLAVLGVMCGAKDVSGAVNDINLVNKVGPMVRAGGDIISTGSKIQDSTDVDAAGIGVVSEPLTGNGTTWVGSTSLQYETTGELARGSRTFDNPDYSALVPLTSGVFASVDGWFDDISNAPGGVGLTFRGVCATFDAVGALAGTVIGAVFPLATQVSEWIASKLIGFLATEAIDVLDPKYAGEAYGEVLSVGSRLYANGACETKGCRPLSDSEELVKKDETIRYLAEKNNNIYDKLTDLDNPYSPASRIYASTVSKSTVENLANIPSILSSSLTNIVSTNARAAAKPSQVYYGVPKSGFTKVEENPYELMDWVAKNITPGDDTTKLFYDCQKVTVTEDFDFITEPDAYLDYDNLKPECKNDNNVKLSKLRQLAAYTDVFETGYACLKFEDDDACNNVYGSDPSIQDPTTEKFRVATINVLGNQHTAAGGKLASWPSGKSRMAELVPIIRQNGINVIGFQELEEDQRSKFIDLTSGEWGIYPEQAEYSNFTSDNSIVWDTSVFDAKIIEGGVHKNLQYLKGKRMDVPWVKLRHKSSGQIIYFKNTHDPLGLSSKDYRVNNAERYKSDLDEKIKNGEKIVLTGDFNSAEKLRSEYDKGLSRPELTYCILTDSNNDSEQKVKMVNSFDKEKDAGACPTKNNSAFGIDHIYYSSDLSVINWGRVTTLDDRKISDHRIVYSDISIGASGLVGSTFCADPESTAIYWPTSPHRHSNTHDIQVPEGTPVHAITKGKVVKSIDLIGCDKDKFPPTVERNCNEGMFSYGRVIKIDHSLPNGIVTYAHLQRRLVNEGDAVAAGQLIGYSGESGNAFGAHLHVDFNGNYTTLPWLENNKALEPPCKVAVVPINNIDSRKRLSNKSNPKYEIEYDPSINNVSIEAMA